MWNWLLKVWDVEIISINNPLKSHVIIVKFQTLGPSKHIQDVKEQTHIFGERKKNNRSRIFPRSAVMHDSKAWTICLRLDVLFCWMRTQSTEFGCFPAAHESTVQHPRPLLVLSSIKYSDNSNHMCGENICRPNKTMDHVTMYLLRDVYAHFWSFVYLYTVSVICRFLVMICILMLLMLAVIRRTILNCIF